MGPMTTTGTSISGGADAAHAGGEAVLAGDIFASEAAFRSFYDRALPRVYAYLASRCGGDSTLAEELAQQAFVAAVSARAAFDGLADPVNWLIGIARHKLADHFRRLDREERRHLRLVVREIAVATSEREWRAREDRAEIDRTLAGLPALQRAVLILHYSDGLSIREIAGLIGRSEAATESLMTRARASFRQRHEETDR